VLLKNEHCNRYRSPTKRNGQSFKNKSNSLCLGRAELKIKKCHTVQPKAQRKNRTGFDCCQQQRKLSNEKLYETEAATTLLFRKMKFLFCLAYNEQGFGQVWH
jgi:hypothetical protein